MKYYYDYKAYSNKTRVRHHEPLYLLQEIADMFDIDLHRLQQKMSVASRKNLPCPQPVGGIKGGAGKLNYYYKRDFAKFLNESA